MRLHLCLFDRCQKQLISTSPTNYQGGFSFHLVVNDRILDSDTGKEVMWRGAGGSYLFHTDQWQLAWQNHLADMVKMNINTMRLAFAFADSTPNPTTGTSSADVLDFAKLDWILDFLDSHGIKAILDLHNWQDMAGDFGSQKWIDDWINIANKYKNDARIVAYELFNEPFSSVWATNITSREAVFQAYKALTETIRSIDPNRIVIWESKSYLPFNLQDYKNQIPSNVVFTHHEWWTNDQSEITRFGSVELSKMVIDYPVLMRKLLNRPFWLGEFGTSGGGNNDWNPADPENQICEQLLYRCEEQVEGWNIWQGTTSLTRPLRPTEIFPLKIYNSNLVRQPWYYDSKLFWDYIVASSGVDTQETLKLSMWHDNDYIVLKPSIRVRVVVVQKQPDGSSITLTDEILNIIEDTTIVNHEGGSLGDRNTTVYAIPSSSANVLPFLLLALPTLLIAYKILVS